MTGVSAYKTYILGDMNINFLIIVNIQTEKYLNMIYNNNFLPLITKPTRVIIFQINSKNPKMILNKLENNRLTNKEEN